MAIITHFRELNVYQAAMGAGMEIFTLPKRFPAEVEAGETQVWLEVSLNSEYISRESFQRLDDEYDKIIGQLVKMMDEPEKWIVRPRSVAARGKARRASLSASASENRQTGER